MAENPELDSTMAVDLPTEGDLSKDGGVMKTIIKPSETPEQHPEEGDEILMHYVGKLVSDGSVFDSSRDRPEPFRFKLGQGMVIKGWDITAKTMAKGEICNVVLTPEYAYGATGSPPKIPPNATLNFEMELVSWISKRDVFSDGGVFKNVIEQGEGWDRPIDNAEVTLHVTATDLTVLDNKPLLFEKDFVFSLGHNQVPKAWETVVRDMKKHAKYSLVCSPPYISGPSLENLIPPTVQKIEFLLHLVQWLPVEDVTKDGNVIKKTIQDGEGWERPNEGAIMQVSANLYVLQGEQRVEPPFQSISSVKFKANDGVLIDGIDRAAQAMKKNERAIVTIQPKFAYQFCPALAPSGVNPDSVIQVDMTLEWFQIGEETWRMTFEEKAKEMEERKVKGNELFKQGRIPMAMRNYERAISFFEYSTSELSVELRKKVNILLVQCHLNMAACLEKLGDTTNVMHHCKKALEIEPSNPKALYRRAGAYMSLGEYIHAETDLRHALDFTPDSIDLKRRMKELSKKRAEQDRKDKEIYANMFSKLAKFEDKDPATKVATVDGIGQDKMDTDNAA